MTDDRQPPIMTQAHIEAMRWVVAEWPYADVRFPRHLLHDIAAHLQALLTAPVPSKSDSRSAILIGYQQHPGDPNIGRPHDSKQYQYPPDWGEYAPASPADWRTEFAPLDMTKYESDQ